MKPERLEIQNVKGIRKLVAEVPANIRVLRVFGKNGSGKSSTTQAFFLAIGGREASKAVDTPLRLGEARGFAEVRFDNGLVVTREWQEGKDPKLKVINPEGEPEGKPQTYLDKLLGPYQFDVLGFAQADEKTQYAALVEFSGLKTQLDALGAESQRVYDERLLIGREQKKYDGAFKSMPREPADTPEAELSISDLLEQLKDGELHNQRCEEAEREVHELAAKIEAADAEIVSLNERLAEIQTKRGALRDRLREASAYSKTIERRELGQIRERIADADTINKAVRIKQARDRARAIRDEAKDDYDAHTATIAEIDRRRAELLASAELPVEGLAVNVDQGVTFNGHPFLDCSFSERLRVALAVAMRHDREIRVLAITAAGELDEDSFEIVEAMAAEHDYLVVAEVVADQIPDGATDYLYLHDGVLFASSFEGPPPKEAA